MKDEAYERRERERQAELDNLNSLPRSERRRIEKQFEKLREMKLRRMKREHVERERLIKRWRKKHAQQS